MECTLFRAMQENIVFAFSTSVSLFKEDTWRSNDLSGHVANGKAVLLGSMSYYVSHR